MALVIKTKNLKWLLDKGASVDDVNYLLAQGTFLEKSKTDFGFRLMIGEDWWVLQAKKFPLAVEEVQQFVATVVKEHKQSPLVKHADTLYAQISQITPESDNQQGGGLDKVVPLREAKKLHQRVIGTTDGSVYVVVAVSKQHEIQVAAKIAHDLALSMRVEGKGLSNADTIAALQSQKLTLKQKPTFHYMSGHYPCTLEAPPAKVIGAILMGCGLHFDTPLPDVAKIKEGSA